MKWVGILLLALLPCSVRAVNLSGLEKDFWFPVGESLTYQLTWGLLPVGQSKVSIDWVEHDGRKVLVARIRVKSSKLVEAIYPVNDFLETLIDPETFLPIRHTKRTSEGRVKANDVLIFDHASGKVRWEDRTRNKTVEYDIQPDTRDLLSFLYSLRKEAFEPKDVLDFNLAADDQIQKFRITAGDPADVEVPVLGKRTCIRLKIDVEKKGFFDRKIPGAIWVSREDPRIVTRMFVRVPVGSVKATLVERTVP